jgi:hypothetical protein
MKIGIMCSALLLSAMLLTECKKDENKVVVSGITETDALGYGLGTVDTTDWKIGDIWTDREEALFHTLELTSAQAYLKSISGINLKTIQIHPASPNPCQTNFNLYIYNGIGVGKFEYVFVNTNLTIISSGVYGAFRTDANSFYYSLNDSIFKPNNIYRMYYKFIIDGVEFKGHGDIKKVE